MRRRLRSAAFPIHRHALPQLALDAGLVALAYYLAYRLRFDAGIPDSLFRPHVADVRVRHRRLAGLLHRGRHVPALDALVLPARVREDRRGRRARGGGADRLRRRGPAAADLDRLRLRRADDPDQRARALRPAAGRLPDRHALPRAPALPAALERLPAAPGRALGADRGRRRRRPAAAAGAAQEPRARLPARRLRRRRPARRRACRGCTARSTTCRRCSPTSSPTR